MVGLLRRILITLACTSICLLTSSAVTVASQPHWTVQPEFEHEFEGGYLDYPEGLAIAPKSGSSEGNIWVADTENSRLEEFNARGKHIGGFGSRKNEPWENESCSSRMCTPIALTSDGKGHLWVVEWSQQRVREYNEAECLREEETHELKECLVPGHVIGGTWGTGNNQFEMPWGVALDSEGNVFVTDAGNGRIQEFSATGAFQTTVGSSEKEKWSNGEGKGPEEGKGSFNWPEGAAIDGSGDVWVTDADNHRVVECSPRAPTSLEWKCRVRFGKSGNGSGGLESIPALAIQADGNVLVSDASAYVSRVEEFTPSGEYVGEFGSLGSGSGQMNYPYGLAVEPDGDVLVVDSGNRRLERWEPSLVGNPETTSLASELQTTPDVPEAFGPFTAAETGRVQELRLRTGKESSQASSVQMGVYSEGVGPNAGKPENVIEEGETTGPFNSASWIKVSGLSVPILANHKYWLVVVSHGGSLHVLSKGTGGTSNVLSGDYEVEHLFNLNEAWGGAKVEGPTAFYGSGQPGVGNARTTLFGVDGAGTDNHQASEWVSHNVLVGRGFSSESSNPSLDVEYNQPPSEVAEHVEAALREHITHPIVTINTPDRTELSGVPVSTYGADTAAIIKEVLARTNNAVTTFELINEPWEKGPLKVAGNPKDGHWTSNAWDYGNLVEAAYTDVRVGRLFEGAPGLTLLVAARGDYRIVKSNGEPNVEYPFEGFSMVPAGGGWVHDMFTRPKKKESEPTEEHGELKAKGLDEIDGWTSHPYGEPTELNHETDGGFLQTPLLRETVGMYGEGRATGRDGYNNWWITEVGFNVTCPEEQCTAPPVVPNTEVQSERLFEDVQQAQILGEAGWLKGFVVYDVANDQGWTIHNRPAGTMYQEFSAIHGHT